MLTNIRQDLLFMAGCIPTAVLCAAAMLERRKRKSRGERPAISDKLLRPPGWSLQIQIENLNDDYVTLMLTAFVCSLASVGALGFPPADVLGRSMWLSVAAIGAAICSIKAWRKQRRMRRLRLGWMGEQAMAEYLGKLASGGCRLFHDVPLDGENVDHVVVGPPGVFAVETKCWSKRPGAFNPVAHQVLFDGKAIRFPWGITERPLNQARRNKKFLEAFLSKSTGERVAVQPIVALPGWWVSLATKQDCGVWVLSGKQVAECIAGEPPKLSPKMIQQVAYQLDQKCRDFQL